MFERYGVLYRQVNQVYRDNYNHLMNSGLYDRLAKEGFLIEHIEVEKSISINEKAYKVILPEQISFVSYPYEWCFNELRDAAILTLDVQQIALDYGMTLKDASAYNIQFNDGRPLLIDTLSFERYIEGRPWVAYRQFCEHFLAPLALMAQKDVRLSKLLIAHIDGIPLDLASRLLPRSSWFKPGLAIHLHIHARTQKAYSVSVSSKNDKKATARPVSKLGLLGIVQGLRKTVKKLHCRLEGTEWGDYYDTNSYSDIAFEEKKRIVQKYIAMIKPAMVWDLGANNGVFSRLASNAGIPTISFDMDPAAVDCNYRMIREKNEKNLLPLLLDLTNPSPGLGWGGRERDSLVQRMQSDCIMALALIHHLAISNNVPLEKIASFFARLCTFLIIEFVPKEDIQVQRLLNSREDIFTEYDQMHFESAFSCFFKISDMENIKDSKRVLYLMQKHPSCRASDAKTYRI